MIGGAFSLSKMCCVRVCVCYVILIIIALTKDSVYAQDARPPATEFNTHRIVKPTVHHARTRRQIATTRDSGGLHHPEVEIRLPDGSEELVLDLALNEGLVSGDHVLTYQRGGKTVKTTPGKEELDICQYQGSVRGKPGSRVAVSTCHGVRGIIYDGNNLQYIEPAQGNEIESDHYLYDHAELNTHYKCGYNGGITNNTNYDPDLLEKYTTEQNMGRSRISRHKRDTNDDEIQVRAPYNSNKLSRYVELVIVVDRAEYISSNEDIGLVHRNMKDVANIINSLYAPLNIFIALVGVVVWTERDEIQLVDNAEITLNNFLLYRRTKLVREIPNDNAQLMTGQKFDNSIVGKGLKGPICTYELSGAVSNNHSEVIGLVAATMAHEMGHNFGMEHDTTDCLCPDKSCIMSPSSTSVMPTHWSSCSHKSLALAFERGMDYCLRNIPKRLFDSPTCGNGFVEPGEQCDCGRRAGGGLDPGGCTACCDPDTCLLRHNATCASGHCCDLQTCRPKPAGTVCRSADKQCDLPEYCTGYSEFCPRDVYKMDTTPCGKGDESYCVRGLCRSRGDQCRLLWGPSGANSHDKCYNSNVKGIKTGNCGYDRTRDVYHACAPRDAFCGLLHCRHLNEHLEFGMDAVANLGAVFINDNGTIIPCRTALVDLGLGDVDPGLVPDGAKCGPDMMCLNQKCVAIADVRRAVAGTDCNGRGTHNSEGNCHCEVGFAAPDCARPGPGGSLDSGPASDPSLQKKFMVAMYIVFLGILPAILLIMFLLYFARHNGFEIWKKPRKSSPSPKKASLPRRFSQSASKFAANFQNNSQNNSPVVHTLSNPDDMSSSLLKAEDQSPGNPTVNFFGNFKGFSLTPVEKTKEEETSVISDKKPVKSIVDTLNKSAKITPVNRSGSNCQSIANQGSVKAVLRSAPPLPVVPTISPKSSPSVKRGNSSVQLKIKAQMNAETQEVPLAPPRPVISSPILEASTCTAKELISPLQGSKTLGPSRAAPELPLTSLDFKRPLSMHSASNVLQKPLPEEPKKVKEGISLNRIASFLKQDKPKKERNAVERSNSLPKNPNHQIKVPKMDKQALRSLKISNPILQKDIELHMNTVPVVSDSEEEGRSFVNRAQSMRAPAGVKPVIQSFGSMRQAPGAPRPVSVVGRPTAPPPPLPSEPPVYQNPKPQEQKTLEYVDCVEEKQAPLAHIDEETDNIYAIIEESPVRNKPLPSVPPVKTQETQEVYKTPKPIASNSGSTESMGLLGEIVNEIQNRNIDSIYSAATLARRKKETENKDVNRNNTYMNTDYKAPESVYSNSGAKSNASTTSSGYLVPSAINVPSFIKKEAEKETGENKTPPSPTAKVNTKIPTFTRQATPPGLKTFKNIPQSPKNGQRNANLTPKVSISPDLVSSCTVPETKNAKPPDVINNNKPTNDTPKVTPKPAVTAKPTDNRPPVKPTPVEKKPVIKTPSLKPVNSSSNLNKVINPPANRVNSKVDSNVKTIADSLNKTRPKVVPKPPSVQKIEPNPAKTNGIKLASKPSNVASLQQKFENRKSIGKDITAKK